VGNLTATLPNLYAKLVGILISPLCTDKSTDKCTSLYIKYLSAFVRDSESVRGSGSVAKRTPTAIDSLQLFGGAAWHWIDRMD
jgi:hypothetical protein